MEPTTQPLSQQAPQPQTPVTSQPVTSVVSTPQHFSASAIIGFSLAILFGATSTYFYLANKDLSSAIEQSSAQASTLQSQLLAQLQKPKDVEVSLVGPVTNGVYKVNDHTLVFLDSTGKTWVVDTTGVQLITTFSFSLAKAKGTDGKATSTLSDWLKTQNTIGTKTLSGAPGTTTISGLLKNDGVVYANAIQVNGQ